MPGHRRGRRQRPILRLHTRAHHSGMRTGEGTQAVQATPRVRVVLGRGFATLLADVGSMKSTTLTVQSSRRAHPAVMINAGAAGSDAQLLAMATEALCIVPRL